ncbi:MAG: hypothetical protein SAK29_08245 [Scytonema sp. PMC 1069.18]|nr:hypothetical protein [Scytonema sp. PMC 1069.18]MEC4880859.1 hypothetical protein [Scytonema sp. PMC 1070.18]
MIISDLQYLETISEDITIVGGALALVGVSSYASGDSTITDAKTRTFVIPLRNDGAIVIGLGRGYAIASDPNDASATVDVVGYADGDIEFVFGKTTSVDSGKKAYAAGGVITVGIDLPG